jgi:putative tryptophan/tyrosine transport system substrate-binding protein
MIRGIAAAFCVLLCICAIGSSADAGAQQAAKVWRIGFIAGGARTPDGNPPAALRSELTKLGYIEGQNVVYYGRWAEAKSERLPELAAELVKLNPDVIVAFGSGRTAIAMKAVTSTIPIVFAGTGDPVAVGLVASYSRPGGNVTGISDRAVELSAKRLDLLKEVVPKAQRIAVLWNADDVAMTLRYREIEKAAGKLQVSVQPLGVREPDDFDTAFVAMTKDRPDAIIMVTDALTILNRKKVVEFATAHGIPAMYEFGSIVREGGFISYGPDLEEMLRASAYYVDRILKGAKPADLPVEQPTRYYLVVNLKTAKSLGITVPQSVLLRADEVIE